MQHNPDTDAWPLEPLIPRTSSYWVMREAISKSGYKHHDGEHLSSEGIYLESVQAMCVRNPILRWGHIEYTATPGEYGKATVLELSWPHPLHAKRKDFQGSKELSIYLKSNMRSGRRIILLEGVARTYVEVLGSHFNMDPRFFASQKRPNSWGLAQVGVERTPNLPSLNNPRRSFMIRYPELRYFPLDEDGLTQLDDKYVKDLDGIRHIDIARRTREIDKRKDLKSGAFSNIGAVGRAASYWSRKYDDGGWDVILLLDPPISKIVKTTRSGEIRDGEELNHIPFRGGYQDFIPYPEGLEESRKFIQTAAAGPGRYSMLEDICFYFTHHAKQLDGFGDEPNIATIFLKKIVASHWLYIADNYNSCAHNLEHHFSRNESFNVFTIPTIERWWGDIHSWHRRCVQHCEELNAILTVLRINPDYVSSNQNGTHPMDSHEDFASIYKRLLWTKSRFEHLLSSVTGLNAIAGNKEAIVQNEQYARRARAESERSLQEARKASILTFLATVFVPLAATAAIFSMSPEWAPGGENFVYYWAITLPLVFLLGGVYYVLGQVLRKSKDKEVNLTGQKNDIEKGIVTKS